jgi:hypothetical protein
VLDDRKVLVELAVKIGHQTVVVELHHDMRQVGRMTLDGGVSVSVIVQEAASNAVSLAVGLMAVREFQLGKQAVGERMGDGHGLQAAQHAFGRLHINRLQPRRAPDKLAVIAPLFLKQNREGAADAALLKRELLLADDQRLKRVQTFASSLHPHMIIQQAHRAFPGAASI